MTKKVAILCAGLDGVMRGYETHCRTFFDCLINENSKTEFVLFKRSGSKSKTEIPLNTPSRTSKIVRQLGKLRGGRLYWEYLLFALKFILYCRVRNLKFDTISCIEPMASKTIMKFKKLLPGNPKIIFTHGVWMVPFEYINNADVIHEVSIENYNRMISYVKEKNINKEIVLLPHFLSTPDKSILSKEQARTKYGINAKKILLSVGAINTVHKRMDYLLEEFSKLKEDWTLVICGASNSEDGNKIIEFAKSKFGKRFVHLYVPREEINDVYALADVFVLCSTLEGFGIVTIEAMRSALPVVLHDTELFRWILKQSDTTVDMEKPNSLANLINTNGSNEQWLNEKAAYNRNTFLKHYCWSGLKSDYLNLLLKE
jgi:glycosyltransferase involved in cell wall biosynthesis